MDSLDAAVRSALPEVADVYLDVTSHRLETLIAVGSAAHNSGTPSREQHQASHSAAM